MNPSLPAEYFDALYAHDPDPWRFATSDYEAAKYAATLEAVSPARFAAGLEIGCSIGVLTRRLAECCDTLLAVDVAEAALDQARQRNADLPHVRFARAAVPGCWPQGRFDLIVLSEVLYYLDQTDGAATAQLASKAALPGGTVLLVHWLGDTNYPRTGDTAVEQFLVETAHTLILQQQARTSQYRLDLLRRV